MGMETHYRLEMINTIPDSIGFYWYTDKGEHTPCVLEVTRAKGKLWANNEEFCFQITKKDCKGTYWCRIPDPYFEGKIVKPMSF
jgi:hypothetical protein